METFKIQSGRARAPPLFCKAKKEQKKEKEKREEKKVNTTEKSIKNMNNIILYSIHFFFKKLW